MAPSRQADNRNVFLLFEDLTSYVFMACIAPGGGAAVGGSLRSSLSGSRPTSHSQGHGRPCLPRPHLRPRFITFQFRVGTIKTLWPRTPISRLLFNSIMVQLERRYPEYDFEHFVQFQFHKGAIRTLARRYSFCSYEKSTNFSYVKFSFTYRSVLLSIDSFHQFIWCKYLHL